MDIANAISSHSEWKIRFRTSILLKERLDAEKIASDQCCELGCWLHGDGRVLYGDLDSYRRCVALHADFHREAARVAREINAGNMEAATRLLETFSDFDNASHAVAVAILKLAKEAEIK